MKSRAKLTKLIQASYKEPYKGLLIQEIKPSIRMKGTGKPASNSFTKLGGIPDLPKGISWPINPSDNEVFTFMGQVDLEELTPLKQENYLPERGKLYFFYAEEEGFGGKVLFESEATEFEQPPLPAIYQAREKKRRRRLGDVIQFFKGKRKLIRESGIDMWVEYYVPSWDSLYMEKFQRDSQTQLKPHLALEELAADDFFDEYLDGESENSPMHLLGGHYKGIQNEYLQLLVAGGSEDVESLSQQEIEEALKWKLLMQFDSDPLLKTNWGDGGRVYFFIHEDDLAKQDFSKVKVCFDCY